MGAQRPEVFFEILKRDYAGLIAALEKRASACGNPVYASLDIRDACWKAAVVDVNLFPAGFNNLTPEDRHRAAVHMKEFLTAKLGGPRAWTLTVVPEAHTNNAGYLENLAGILAILREAGAEPRLLWPGPAIPKPWTIKTASGQDLVYLPATDALANSEALLLNHDLSGGVPAAIKDVALPTFPNPRLGWYRRRKSKHHEIVDAVLKGIEKEFPQFDPWYVSLRTVVVPQVDFDSEEGLDRVAAEATKLMETLAADYAVRGITEQPRIFIKNDAGTYGIGVVSVKDPNDIRQGGRWLRNKMRKGKESVPISQVIVQEAVPSALVYQREDGKPETTVVGEPALYLVNGRPVGGFCRLHEKLGPDARWENLNQPGSLLEPLSCDKPPAAKRPFPRPRQVSPCEQLEAGSVYAFLARLHAIAAGLEECPQI